MYFLKKLNISTLKTTYIFSCCCIPLMIAFTIYFYKTGVVLKSFEDEKKDLSSLLNMMSSTNKVNCSAIPSEFDIGQDEFRDFYLFSRTFDSEFAKEVIVKNLRKKVTEGKVNYFWWGHTNKLKFISYDAPDAMNQGTFGYTITRIFTASDLLFNHYFHQFNVLYRSLGGAFRYFESPREGFNGEQALTHLEWICRKKREAEGITNWKEAGEKAEKHGKQNLFVQEEELQFFFKTLRSWAKEKLDHFKKLEDAYEKARLERKFFYVYLALGIGILFVPGVVFKELRRRRIPKWGQFYKEWGTDNFGNK